VRLALLLILSWLPAASAADLPMPPAPGAQAKAKPASRPAPAEATDARPTLVVTDLVAQGVPPEQAAAFTDAVVQALSERRLFRVISSRDIQTVLGAERQRQIYGACAEEQPGCSNDLRDALGAQFVVSGALSRVGAAYQLSLQMVDSFKGRPVARSARLAGDLDVLQKLVPYAASEATGSPLPPPASRALQYSMLAGGGASFIAGGFLGMLALSRQGVINDELCPGGALDQIGDANRLVDTCAGQNLRPRSFYLEQDQAIGAQKTLALALMVLGTGLAAGGLYLMPPPEGGPRVALSFTGTGLFLVGELP
jgi:TolB-like protein